MAQKQMVSVYPVRYIDDRLEYLILKRATPSFNWQCVTGSVGRTMSAIDHPLGERPLECAKRELLEETGYKPSIIVNFDPPNDFYKDDEVHGKKLSPKLKRSLEGVSMYNFITRIDQVHDPILNPVEHTEWKWCSYDIAYNLILWGVEKKALRIVNEYLINNPLSDL